MPEHSPTAAGRPALHPDDTQARVLLRMLHGARGRGDEVEATRAWGLIVSAEIERVRCLVSQFRHDTLPGGRVASSDVDDVAHAVFVRLHDKVESFKGASVGELRNFMRTATRFECLDYLDRVVRDEQGRAGSLDGGADDPDSTANRLLDAIAAQAAAASEADDAADAADAVERAQIHAALMLVDPDKRAVLVMTAAGAPIGEIQEVLGISRDAVYQRRRRGLIDLREAAAELAEEDDEA